MSITSRFARVLTFVMLLGFIPDAFAQDGAVFRTLNLWSTPRLYLFFQVNLEKRQLIYPGRERTPIALKSSESCPAELSHADLRIRHGARTEVLLSDDGKWVAIQMSGDLANSGQGFNLPNFTIYLRSLAITATCEFEVDESSVRSFMQTAPLPALLFSDESHQVAGRSFAVREDFLLSLVRFRVHASTRLRSVSFDATRVFMPMLGAEGQMWMNKYGKLGLNFDIRQSFQSFPVNLFNSEWGILLGPRISFNTQSLFFLLQPLIGVRQQLLLGDVNLTLSDEARSVSTWVAGARFDFEFSKRWLLRGEGLYSLKEYEKSSAARSSWQYLKLGGAVGFRLRPELRLLGEAAFETLTLDAYRVTKLDLFSFAVELDF